MVTSDASVPVALDRFRFGHVSFKLLVTAAPLVEDAFPPNEASPASAGRTLPPESRARRDGAVGVVEGIKPAGRSRGPPHRPERGLVVTSKLGPSRIRALPNEPSPGSGAASFLAFWEGSP